MRASVFAVAAVAAILGAGLALALGSLVGVSDGSTTTVLVQSTVTEADAGATTIPALGNRFDPAAIYAHRAPGVVTLYADLGADGQSQGSGFVVDAKGTILTNAHVVTNVAEGGGAASRVPRSSTSSSATATGCRRRSSAGTCSATLPPSGSTRRPRAGAGAARPLVDGPRRHARGGDRQPVRRAELALGRRRLGDRPDDRLAHLGLQRRRRDPDRRADQPRQLRRAALRCERAGDRHQRPDPFLERQRRGGRFAIPIDTAKRALDQLLRTGKVAYAYVGVTTQDVTPGLARKFGLDSPHGALIAKVEPGTPAARAGLHGATRTVDYNGREVSLGGDVIVDIDGMQVAGADDVSRAVARLAAGQQVTFTVLRDGTDRRAVKVTLAERPA